MSAAKAAFILLVLTLASGVFSRPTTLADLRQSRAAPGNLPGSMEFFNAPHMKQFSVVSEAASLCDKSLALRKGWNQKTATLTDENGQMFALFTTTITNPRSIMLSTCSPNYHELDTQIFVYATCPFSAEPELVAYADDSGDACWENNKASVLNLFVPVGTYWVLVKDWSGARIAFDLYFATLEPAKPPKNLV